MSVATEGGLKGRSFTKVADWTRPELEALLDLADELKRDPRRPLLPGRTLGMIFEKPSNRTRVSFDVGMFHLGGTAFYISGAEIQLGKRETIKDTAHVLSRYLDAIVIRTFAQ